MNQSATLNWGILGAARVNQRLLPAIVEASNSRLVAIASRRPGAAAATLAQYAPKATGVETLDNPEQLLNHPEIRAVYLPMANQEHYEWALRAIEQGKHVLCEKPMALHLADIEAIEAAAAKHQVKVMEGFMYRFHPQFARARELLDSGLIGEIRYVRSCFAFMMKPARLYRIDRSIADGGGAMWDIGCYAIHTARAFFDQPPVAASAIANYVDSGADVSCSGMLDFSDGRFAQFEFSFEHARRSEYEIVGTKGGLKCETVWAMPEDVPLLTWWTEDGKQGHEQLSPANHFKLEVEHFSDCVLNGKSPALTFADAKDNCRVICAALESAASGQRIMTY